MYLCNVSYPFIFVLFSGVYAHTVVPHCAIKNSSSLFLCFSERRGVGRSVSGSGQ